MKWLSKFTSHLSPLLFFLFILFVYREWFFGTSILTYSDWIYVYPESHEINFLVPSAWLYTQLGGVNLFSYFYPIQAGMSVLNSIGFSYGVIERVFFLIPAVVLGYFGMYFLNKDIYKNSFVSTVSAVVFIFNTYSLLIGTSHLTILAAMALIPWIFYFYVSGLNETKVWKILFTAFFLGLASAYEFRIFYIASFLVFFYFIFSLSTIKESLRNKGIKTLLFLLSFVFAGALNFYWLLGLTKAGSISTNEYFSRELFGNNFMSIERAMTLFHPFWTGGYVSAFSIQEIPWYFLSIPIAAFTGLYFGRKNKDVLFWGMIALLGIFLTKQVSPPFENVYNWLFQHFPGFNSFREASKFYILIALGYSVLIGSFVEKILFYIKTKKLHPYFGGLIILGIVSVFLFNTKAILSKEIGALFVPRHIPKDYLVVKELIQQDNNFSRTLWIPRKSRWSFYTIDHPLVSSDEVIDSVWSKFVESENKKLSSSEKMFAFIQQKNFSNLLKYSGIRYVIVPMEDKENDDNFYQYYSKKDDFVQSLSQNIDLKKLDVKSGEVAVFEVQHSVDRFFMTHQKEFLDQSVNTDYEDNISHTRLSSYSYKVELTNVSNNVFLHFADLYHPRWKLYSDTTYKFFPRQELEAEHFQNDVLMNGFVINLESVCQKVTCHQNSDGTKSLSLVVFFNLQYYFFIGLVIGGVGLIGAIITSILLYRYIKHAVP